MSNIVKGLSEAVCSHVLSAYMLKVYITVADLVLNVVVVDVDVFCARLQSLRW
jgi:hypothetical protein